MGNTSNASPPPGAETLTRVPQLDVLRAVAILLVLVAHVPFQSENIGPFLPLSHAFEQVGWTGVDLFFVLSGFLIGGLLFGELRKYGSLDVRRFIIRRGFKIWPSYYVYLLFQFVRLLAMGVSLWVLVPFLLHVQNYFSDFARIPGHVWSLAVEEHFYLLLPVLLAMMTRPRGAVIVPGFVILAAACAAMRFQAGEPPPVIKTHLRVDSLAFGVLLAFVYHYHRPVFERIARQRVLLTTLGLILVAVSSSIPLHSGPWGFAAPTGLFLGYGAILVVVVSLPTSWFEGSYLLRLLAFVGLYSYSIYLWHLDIGFRVARQVAGRWAGRIDDGLLWPLAALGYIVLAIGTGMLMSRLIEMPALALRDRLFPRKTTAVVTPAASSDSTG